MAEEEKRELLDLLICDKTFWADNLDLLHFLNNYVLTCRQKLPICDRLAKVAIIREKIRTSADKKGSGFRPEYFR